jgi:hypothetical protein
MMTTRLIPSILLFGMAALLVACGGGGGGGGGNSGSTTPSLSGVAAIGVALTNASVTLKDSTGKTATTSTDESGNFIFNNINSFTPPLMLQVKGAAAGKNYVLHSLMTIAPVQGSNILNVTPATDAITTQTLGADPEVTFDTVAAIQKIDPAKLVEAKAKLVAALKDAMANLNIENLDVMTGKFAADKTGMDKLFDLVAFSPDSKTGAITLTNKNTNESTTVNSSAKPTDVPKLVLSKSDASFDLSGIDKFVQSFIAIANANDLTKFRQIVDLDYLHQGSTYTKAIEEESNATNSTTKLTGGGYAVQKCDPTTKVCNGTLNLKISGVSFPLYMPIKLGADGNWRFYGDRAPFYIDMYPVFIHSEAIDSTTKTATSTADKVGIALDFSGDSCGSCNDNKYKSSLFEMSTDSGATYSLLFKIQNTSMKLEDGNGNVTALERDDDLDQYFLPTVDTKTITAFNTALQAGQLKLRIKAYTSTNYTGTPVVWEPQVLAPLFTKESAAPTLEAQKLTIDAKSLGTASVSFTGKNLIESFFGADYTTTTTTSATTTKYSYKEYFSFEELSALNGVVTTATINSQCNKELTLTTNQTDINWRKTQCEALSKPGVIINEAVLLSQTPQGGRVYLKKKIP